MWDVQGGEVTKSKPDVPKMIYLQVYGEDDPYEDKRLRGEVDWREVSWCRDRIWDSDLEYVLVKKGRKRDR